MAARIRTALHELLPALRVPVVSAPMAGAAGGALAAEVSKAGGLGFIGAGYLSPQLLKNELEIAKQRLPSQDRLEIGVGFLVWRLASLDRSPGSVEETIKSSPKAIECIDLVLGYKPRVIWLAFSNEPSELKHWKEIFVKRQEQLFGGERPWKLFIGVGNEEEARFAADLGADVIIAQGIESGGHGLATSPPISTFLTTLRTSKYPIILGAGGLSTGSDLAAVLAHGAQGAVYGTRFLLTPESTYSEIRKEVLLKAEGSGTKRSHAFDQARGTTEWPAHVDGRGVSNETVKDFDDGVIGIEERQKRYGTAEKEGEKDRLVVWAGTGVGNMKQIKPAGDVVRDLEQEAIEALQRAASCLN